MLNKTIITLWRFIFNIISIDTNSLREDSRKVGLALTSTGFLGFIIELDKISSSESLLVFVVGILIWICAIIKPKVEDQDFSEEEKSDNK